MGGTGAGAPFVHLRVASAYSLRYGPCQPAALVERAAELGMDAIGLADRDGLYGAVRFASACLRTGLSPIVGVDFASTGLGAPPARPPTAAKGGEQRDPRLPRVVVLATAAGGWSQLCRLTSQVHLHGERGTARLSLPVLAEQSAGGGLVTVLGIDSAFGRAVLQAGGTELARRELLSWRDRVGVDQLVVALSDLMVGGGQPGCLHQAVLMAGLARQAGVQVIMANPIRMISPAQAPVCDVLDATRRLVPLDEGHLDRRNAEGWLKPTDQMTALAGRICAAGGGLLDLDPDHLLGRTRELAERCRLDPQADIGLGQVHLPEFELVAPGGRSPAAVLRERCEAGIPDRYPQPSADLHRRLEEELAVISGLGFESYFLTVAQVVDAVRSMGIRCAARGSGAGSLVNHLLGISGVDPLAYGLIMERFLSPLRRALPDIDLDVESARRTEIYQRVFEIFGGERVACLAMVETYRVRHAVRDVGAALSLPPGEVDAMAKAFPHIRARDARAALRDLPELRATGMAEERLDVLFRLVEALDGLPRHLALHPCGIILSDAGLAGRTPLEASFGGFPMSQFDKDDVEDLGLLKLDVLGVRMQSAMAHALDEVERTEGHRPDIDALAPFDDPQVYDLIQHAQTLGCFQIESPGQRELVGKFGPDCFNDLTIDISLFRPGPVKSDMVVPFLNARQGWNPPHHLHPSLVPALAETGGVVVYHEQVIMIISVVSGCSLARGDEVRRALGDREGRRTAREWFWPRARLRGYREEEIQAIWSVLESFASFGFCKAHAAAFALPTYQSAWLKRHHPAAFIAGLLTHDPGMYPQRLLLAEARRMGIAILGLDVNLSAADYRVEALGERARTGPEIAAGLPDARGWGIRLALSQVRSISAEQVARIVLGQPYGSLSDFWARAGVDTPVAENLVLAGAFDALYRLRTDGRFRPGQVTRRDLLLHLADLTRLARSEARTLRRARGLRGGPPPADGRTDPAALAARQAVGEVIGSRAGKGLTGVQLALDLDDPEAGQQNPAGPGDVIASGLAEMTPAEQLEAELSILGLDSSAHLMAASADFCSMLGVVSADQLLSRRNRSRVVVAGVKVATQTPPIRTGRRVVFLTLDDGTGPVDATFFEDAQAGYSGTVFSSWLLVVRGTIRRTGPRGISLLAQGAWDLPLLERIWRDGLARGEDPEQAMAEVWAVLDAPAPTFPDPGPASPDGSDPLGGAPGGSDPADDQGSRSGGMGPRRVLVHPTGFLQSPYADVAPAGVPAAGAPRKLWHSSPGSSGR